MNRSWIIRGPSMRILVVYSQQPCVAVMSSVTDIAQRSFPRICSFNRIANLISMHAPVDGVSKTPQQIRPSRARA